MMTVAILCGGLGTRLGSLTKDTPKYLVRVNGTPFARLQLELLKRHGYTDVVLCVGHLGDQIERVMQDGSALGMTIRYAYDPIGSSGTAQAMLAALPLLGDRFFTLYGDSYLECHYAGIEDQFRANTKPALMTTFEGIDYGLSAFTADAFRMFGRFSKDIPDVHRLLKLSNQLDEYPIPCRWHEIGSPSGLAALQNHVLT